MDINKVIKMCLIHDLGECFTGDIPCFKKTEADEETEENLLYQWVATLPEPLNDKMRTLYQEMSELKTLEAKIYKHSTTWRAPCLITSQILRLGAA